MESDKSEQSLLKASFLDSILNSAKFGIASYAPIRDETNVIIDFEILYSNWEVPSNFGYTAKDVIGKKCSEVYPGIFENGVFDRLKSAVETGVSDTYEINASTTNEPLWLSAFVEVLDGVVNVTSKNVTLEKKNAIELEIMNSRLARKNDELASFAYIASHDLQEPLRKIMMFTSRIMEKEKNLGQQSRDYFENISATADRMQKLIRDLLSYSKLDGESQKKEKTNLNSILKEMLSGIQHPIEITKNENLPIIKAIPSQISQLFCNLIDNSVKYRKADTNLEISINVSHEIIDTKNWLKISFSDNGIGFDPQYKSKIFEVFQRLHGKQEYSGSGVGLSICKKIMENHAGFIDATGEFGIGATFNLYFPSK